MANLTPKTDHLRISQWRPGQSGNPAGKPKGTKHLSTWIRELMEDDNFEQKIKGGGTIKGAPVKAIIATVISKAVQGDLRAFGLLAKYGYGNKIDVTSNDSANVNVFMGISELSDEELVAQIDELRKYYPNPLK